MSADDYQNWKAKYEAELTLARARLGPAGYKILQEYQALTSENVLLREVELWASRFNEPRWVFDNAFRETEDAQKLYKALSTLTAFRSRQATVDSNQSTINHAATFQSKLTAAIAAIEKQKPFIGVPEKDYYRGQWDALDWVLESIQVTSPSSEKSSGKVTGAAGPTGEVEHRSHTAEVPGSIPGGTTSSKAQTELQEAKVYANGRAVERDVQIGSLTWSEYKRDFLAGWNAAQAPTAFAVATTGPNSPQEIYSAAQARPDSAEAELTTWGTDACPKCETGRLTLYVLFNRCIECRNAAQSSDVFAPKESK